MSSSNSASCVTFESEPRKTRILMRIWPAGHVCVELSATSCREKAAGRTGSTSVLETSWKPPSPGQGALWSGSKYTQKSTRPVTASHAMQLNVYVSSSCASALRSRDTRRLLHVGDGCGTFCARVCESSWYRRFHVSSEKSGCAPEAQRLTTRARHVASRPSCSSGAAHPRQTRASRDKTLTAQCASGRRLANHLSASRCTMNLVPMLGRVHTASSQARTARACSSVWLRAWRPCASTQNEPCPVPRAAQADPRGSAGLQQDGRRSVRAQAWCYNRFSSLAAFPCIGQQSRQDESGRRRGFAYAGALPKF
eukprot:scaffold42332_cov63-Phaeocystis_antarctica.AAC.2